MDIQQSMAWYVAKPSNFFRFEELKSDHQEGCGSESLKIKSRNTPTCALLQGVAHLNYKPRPMKEAPHRSKRQIQTCQVHMGPIKSI